MNDLRKLFLITRWLFFFLLFYLHFGLANPFPLSKILQRGRISHNRINPRLIHTHSNTNHHVDILNNVTAHSTATNKSGYGIVFTGNVDLFPLIYVSISILDYLNFTSYPIEIFVNGRNQNEDIVKCKNMFIKQFESRLSIKCMYINDNNVKFWNHFSYKPLALLLSSFRHVLFLDDDNILLQSPSILFESAEYISNHAIFWPDFWGKSCDGKFEGGYILYGACLEKNGIYNKLNLKYDGNDLKYTQSQEAAQLVVDTVKYYDTLQAVLNCTEKTEYQQYLHGDKDCFRFMFLQRNESFYFTPILPQYVGFTRTDDKNDTYFYRHALLQLWRYEANVMFIHQTKWIEPMDHKLWQYFQRMTVPFDCAVHNGQDHIYPIPNEKYQVLQTKINKTNGRLIYELESKWIEFWHKVETLL